MKLAIVENLKIPTQNLTDDVNTTNENPIFNNTTFGEIIIRNLTTLFAHFDIDNDINSTKVETTYGISCVPLGVKRYLFNYNFRVRIIEFVLVVLHYFKNVKGVLDNILIRSNFFKLSWEYLYRYEWHNSYQYHFEHLYKYILENASFYNQILTHLFNELKITEEIINNNKCIQFSYKYVSYFDYLALKEKLIEDIGLF